ncbi:type IV pilus modification protein PilV [Acinetobacter sp. YH12145]|uniref:type IV pilus modification protein PilV n=1 Tax=Acinetobacter sp. YH12145 TaxID=2601129 RepID=UPI0015D10008|nr:type IV pilus modification protein PilV [Acinetobacter sp. YH12145]
MKNIHEKGIGLVEVIVALLLLSIGVLGFSMLQIRAMEASLDASKRIQAMNLARDLSERMRANKQGLTKFTVGADDSEKIVDAYTNALTGKYYITSYSPQCTNTSKCSSAEFAQEDVNQILFRANTLGMKVAVNDCPGDESSRNCVFVAWGETNPVDGSAATSCTQNGSFLSSSKCIVLEAY